MHHPPRNHTTPEFWHQATYHLCTEQPTQSHKLSRNGNRCGRPCRKVLATEMSKTSVAAAKVNIAANENSDNIEVVRLSSEELTLALDKVKYYTRLDGVDLDSFDLQTVLVDPPRAGMGPEAGAYTRSLFSST
jgi:hypothetical protein